MISTIFQPLYEVIFQIGVAIPITLIYYVMKTINLLVNISLGTMFETNGSFNIIFTSFISISFIFFLAGVIYAISKAIIETRDDESDDSFKNKLLDIGKSTIITSLIILALPAFIIILSTLLNSISDFLFANIQNPDGSSGSSIKDNDALFAASIIMVGYRPTDLTAYNQMRDHIAQTLIDGGWLSIIDGSLGSFEDWSVPIAALSTLLICFAYFRLAIGVISKVLEVYLKIMVAPLILYFKAYDKKIKMNYMSNLIQKITTMSFILIGYRLVLIIYSIFQTQLIPNIVESLGNNTNSLIGRFLTALILFIGVQLVSAIPNLVLIYFFKPEQVGNEWRNSKSEIQAALAPIRTTFVMASNVIGVSGRNYQQNIINKAANFTPPPSINPNK